MSEEYQDINSKQTILQHGLSVWNKFTQLIQYLESSNEEEYQHPLPKWTIEYKHIFLPIIKRNLSDIKNYLIYHDCGKPFCLKTDENGRHFTNHAEISKQTFLKYSDNQIIADLIGKDMLCHLTKAKDYTSIVHDEHIEILLCSALAELHSNAIMFGGFDSDSFKIKFKNLNKLGSRIFCEKYNLTT
jgi:hypothetical protein